MRLCVYPKALSEGQERSSWVDSEGLDPRLQSGWRGDLEFPAFLSFHFCNLALSLALCDGDLPADLFAGRDILFLLEDIWSSDVAVFHVTMNILWELMLSSFQDIVG